MTGINEFYEDPYRIQELQKRYPLEKPAYWSMFDEIANVMYHLYLVGAWNE